MITFVDDDDRSGSEYDGVDDVDHIPGGGGVDSRKLESEAAHVHQVLVRSHRLPITIIDIIIIFIIYNYNYIMKYIGVLRDTARAPKPTS